MWIGLGVTVLVLLLGGLGVGGFLLFRAGSEAVQQVTEATEEVTGEGEFTRVGPVTIQTVRALSELTTVELIEYTVVEKGDDRGWLNWASGDKLSMFAVARIGAGVDLREVEPEDISADPTTGRALIELPPGEITYVAVDNDATHVYDRETGILTRGDPDLERAARLAAEEVLVDQALEAGLLGLAEERARLVLTELLTGLGYTDIEVIVRPSPS